MRVLTVGSMYPPHHFGGYELVWHSAVEHLRAREHEVEVLATDARTGSRQPDGPGVYRQLRWALRDARFESLAPRARLELARHNHRTLVRRLDEFRPDIVAWWAMGGLTLGMLERVRRRKLPAVAFVHDDWLDYGRWADAWLHTFRGQRAHVGPIAEKLFGIPVVPEFAGAARYVFVSERTRQHALDQGLGLSDTGIAHSGIHEDFLTPARESSWEWRLLYVGRLDPRKGVDTVVEALAHLPAQARLELVGGWDTAEEARLHRLAATAGVEARVHFAGHCERGDIVAAYGRADAVVFPVRWEEPWGLVPLEAMGRGRPVVATGRGGSAEYLRNEHNCLLFEADDAGGLAAAIGRLGGDEALRDRLRRGGLETAPRYTEALFNEAVEAELTGAVERAHLLPVAS